MNALKIKNAFNIDIIKKKTLKIRAQTNICY